MGMSEHVRRIQRARRRVFVSLQYREPSIHDVRVCAPLFGPGRIHAVMTGGLNSVVHNRMACLVFSPIAPRMIAIVNRYPEVTLNDPVMIVP